VSGSVIRGNIGGGIDAGGGFDIFSNLIVRNGSVSAGVGGVYLHGGSNTPNRFAFNTVSGNTSENDIDGFNADGVRCTGNSALKNNIVHANPEMESPAASQFKAGIACLVENTGGNGAIGNKIRAGTIVFGGASEFHLQSSSTVEKGEPISDIQTDIDGKQRANPPSVGANEP